MPKLDIQQHVPLAPLTTLGLGGPARYFVSVRSESEMTDAFRWAEVRGVPVEILAGGSNVVVPDEGYPGLVIHVELRGCSIRDDGLVRVSAGEPWDPVVQRTVAAGLAGFECLSGIPGSVGATPIQNVGAYGQEVANTLLAVKVLTTDKLETAELGPVECEFAYRDSVFKRHPGRWVVLEVTFRLHPRGTPTHHYPELAKAVGRAPTLLDVRDAVLTLRRRKSMVIEPGDPNRRSAGSFFLNPVVSNQEADRIEQTAIDEGLVERSSDMPRYPVTAEHSKLAAAWLIERAGFAKGFRRGAVGISSNHALALIHHGGGTSAELLSLAGEIRERVADLFGVTLGQEPRILGQPSA